MAKANVKTQPKLGRKSLPVGLSKKTIGVGLRGYEVKRLDDESASKRKQGFDVDQSNMGRIAIVSYLALLDLIRDGKVSANVLEKINQHRVMQEKGVMQLD